MYKIFTIGAIGKDIWDEYVAQHEHGTVFHTSYMFEVWNGVRGYEPFAFCAVDEMGNIFALLNGYIQTVGCGFLTKLSRRSILLQAPLYDSPESLMVLLDKYRGFSAEKGLVYTEVRNHYFRDGYNNLMLGSGYKWEGHYNIVKELPDTSQDLWKQIQRKRKDGINKAKKYEFKLVTEIGINTVRDFYDLIKLKYQDLGLPIPPITFFQNCSIHNSDAYCRYLQLVGDSKIRVSLLAFVYKSTLHAVYIGNDTDADFLNKRPIDLFYYMVMGYCIESGVKFFDWMGAGKPGVAYGVRDFKLQYGGELVDYGRYIYTSRPLLLKLSIIGFNFLKMIRKRTK